MGYCKVVSYDDIVEVHEYEKDIEHFGRGGKRLSRRSESQTHGQTYSDLLRARELQRAKRKDNAVRASINFKCIVQSNIAQFGYPLFFSLTYREKVTDIKRGYSDFRAFTRALRFRFGESFSYIAVPEFQKRGAIHFHALFWGIGNSEVAANERVTRTFAKLWGQGFIDIRMTDGEPVALASYLAKYMSKSYLDPRMFSVKSYVCSRNIARPVVKKNELVMPYFQGGLLGYPDLSTASVLKDVQFSTQWLGKGRVRIYKLNP